jgi:CheY-like chemotaxis protein
MSSSKPTVLIVDDNEELLGTYSHLLPLLGYTVITAPDGLHGLEMISALSAEIACVVIDVRMPELNGYQLVQALRGDPATEHLPLVMLTAMTQDVDHLHGRFVGVDFYLDKPVLPEDLIATIEQAARLTSVQRFERLLADAQQEETEG